MVITSHREFIAMRMGYAIREMQYAILEQRVGLTKETGSLGGANAIAEATSNEHQFLYISAEEHHSTALQ